MITDITDVTAMIAGIGDVPYQVIGVAAIAATFVLIKLLDSTDIPKIKNLPSIPGVPIFGNLLQLGTDHARVAAKWAEQYGPVFQTRLGTKVNPTLTQYEWIIVIFSDTKT